MRIAKNIIHSDSEKHKKAKHRVHRVHQINHTRIDDLSDHTSYYNANPKFVAIEPTSAFGEEQHVKIVANDLTSRFENLVESTA